MFLFNFQAFKDGLAYHLDKFKYSNATTGTCSLKCLYLARQIFLSKVMIRRVIIILVIAVWLCVKF